MFFPLNQAPCLRQHLCHEAVTEDRLSPRLLLLPEMCLWCLQHSGEAGTPGKKQEDLSSDAPAGEESVLVVPSLCIAPADSRDSDRLKHSPHQSCPTDSAVPRGWAGAAAARGMQGQAQSLAAVASTPHLPQAGYLTLLQLRAVPGWQLCVSVLRRLPGPSPALLCPGSYPKPRVWVVPLAPHLRGTEGRRSSAQVGGTVLPLNPSSQRSRALHGPTLVVYELQVLEVLQRSRAGLGTSRCSPGTSEC